MFRSVEYSKSMPLSLGLISSSLSRTDPDQSLSRLLDPVAPRLRNLNLVIDREADEVVAALREAPPAPGLRSLSITAKDAAVLLPRGIFSHDTAQLQRLTLVDCFVPIR